MDKGALAESHAHQRGITTEGRHPGRGGDIALPAQGGRDQDHRSRSQQPVDLPQGDLLLHRFSLTLIITPLLILRYV